MNACKYYNTKGYYRCALKMQKPCNECGQFEATLIFTDNTILGNPHVGSEFTLDTIIGPDNDPNTGANRGTVGTVIPDTDAKVSDCMTCQHWGKVLGGCQLDSEVWRADCIASRVHYKPVQHDTDAVRNFDTGATRDTDTGKHDYEGFLSPLVLERFAEYMTKHRTQSDGGLRDSDNWQKGIPKDAYMKSGFRHFMDWWKEHRGIDTGEGLEDALCALLFNVQGYLLETLYNDMEE